MENISEALPQLELQEYIEGLQESLKRMEEYKQKETDVVVELTELVEEMIECLPPHVAQGYSEKLATILNALTLNLKNIYA